jgi:hypothetical protein
VASEGFRVQAPVAPSRSEDVLQTPAGPIPVAVYDYIAPGASFFVRVATAPPELAARADLPAIMARLKEEYPARVNGRGDRFEQVTIAGAPAVEITVRGDDGQSMFRLRAVVIGNRYYEAEVQWDGDPAIGPEAEKFLKSFEVIGEGL